MMNHALRYVLLFLLCTFAYAEERTPIEPQFRYGKLHTTYVIHEDGTSTESHSWSMTILKESVVSWAKQASISYSTSVQTAEVLEAYTQKPDGRRLDVSKESYQIEVNGGIGDGAPAFSDRTTLSAVFPDVAVGDTVVFSYRIHQKEAIFPGHFSISGFYGQQYAFDDVHVRIEYPSVLWVQYEANGLKENSGSADGRNFVEWSYANASPMKSSRRDYSVFVPEKEAGYSFSTFKNYADIAVAYGERATPKAAVTPRIQQLANEISKEATQPREQARLLYEWVAKNITYAGNCVGIGAVVPRDLDFVLDHKMGDCKDHATLLQALLAARGIQSWQALINAGSMYHLPKVPVVTSVNHVINYLPTLDLYLDSTSSTTPFGMLPPEVRGKPVLWVQNFNRDSRTPTAETATWQKIVSDIRIGDTGSVEGAIEISQKGDAAIGGRAMFRDMPKEVENDFVKNWLRSMRLNGSGTLTKDDPTELKDSYHFKLSFKADKFIKFPGSGAFYIFPLITGGASNYDFLATGAEVEPEADVVCTNGVSIEEYTFHLPQKMKVLSVPDSLKIKNSQVSFDAMYKLNNGTLQVKRTLIDRTKGSVCSSTIMAEFKKMADQATENLKSQVLYR
ncbi:MAG: DUF3857 domain-containing protein [Burkholderiaceae bacterium]|nr:MAG: DUF3857 domain-containing protein [Burkholderiaceae bacterium]